MAKDVAKATGVIVIINLVVKLLGFVRETFIANGFGASSVTDAYLVAYTLPYFLQAILGFALVTLVVPILTKYWVAGEDAKACRLGSSLINVTFVGLVLLTVLGMVFARGLVFITAPNLPQATADLAVQLTRIMFPSVVFMGVAMVITGIHNSSYRFIAGASAPGVSNIIIILGVVFFASYGIEALAWATLVSFLGFLLIQIPPLLRHGFKYSPVFDYKDPEIRHAVRDILPIVLGVAVNQIYFAINRIFASGLEPGSISALNYASKLMNLPVGIFVAAVAAAVYPALAEKAMEASKKGLAQTLNRGLLLVGLIAIPSAVGLLVLRTPIVKLLFERGAFDAYATQITAYALLFFVIGLVPVAMNMVITRAYYATGDVRTPVIMGVVSIALNVAFSFLFLKSLAHGGLALANSLAALANTLLLFYFLRNKIEGLGGRDFFIALAKMLAASLLMGLCVWGVMAATGSLAAQSTTMLALAVMLAIFVGVAVYLTAGFVLKVNELVELWVGFKRKLRKP